MVDYWADRRGHILLSDLPQSPSIANSGGTVIRAEDVNPDMAAAVLARDLVKRLPAPAILSKKFVIYHGIFKAMDHSETNKTYFSCSPLLLMFEKVSEGSVNVDGWFGEHIFAYLMKPKFIIQGLPNQANTFDQQEPGFFERLKARITGRDPNAPQQVGS